MPLSPSYPFATESATNMEYMRFSLSSQTTTWADVFVSLCRSSSPLLETSLQRSAAYEHELKDLEVRSSAPPFISRVCSTSLTFSVGKTPRGPQQLPSTRGHHPRILHLD